MVQSSGNPAVIFVTEIEHFHFRKRQIFVCQDLYKPIVIVNIGSRFGLIDKLTHRFRHSRKFIAALVGEFLIGLRMPHTTYNVFTQFQCGIIDYSNRKRAYGIYKSGIVFLVIRFARFYRRPQSVEKVKKLFVGIEIGEKFDSFEKIHYLLRYKIERIDMVQPTLQNMFELYIGFLLEDRRRNIV